MGRPARTLSCVPASRRRAHSLWTSFNALETAPLRTASVTRQQGSACVRMLGQVPAAASINAITMQYRCSQAVTAWLLVLTKGRKHRELVRIAPVIVLLGSQALTAGSSCHSVIATAPCWRAPIMLLDGYRLQCMSHHSLVLIPLRTRAK